ncbi:LTA synthase family protein [Clostridium tetanomorphum]|uniref:LTA synthase family protein n=1 Tax=Clostridium tetanomorphum TaxID=1553 RepID=A0A923EB29_CLOTT|nr:LTA synthase family protein [Clostridium tetanomorphum]
MNSFTKKIATLFKNHWLFTLTVVSIYLKSLAFVSYIASSSGNVLAISKLPMYLVSSILYISIIIVFLSFGYIFKGRAQFIAFWFINLIISLFMLFDIIYYRGFQGLMSPYNLSQKGNLGNLGDTIISMIRTSDIVFFIDLIFLLFIFFIGKNIYKNIERKLITFLVLLLVGGGIGFYYHYRYDILENGKNKRYFFIYWSPLYNISNMSPLGYHIYDSYLYIKNSQRLTLKDTDIKDALKWYEDKKENLPDNKYKGLLKGKNLIAIQVESLENFVIAQKIQGQEITPNLNKLLKNSLYFPEIYEQVCGGNSSDSDLMTNTSAYPVRNGSTFFRFPDNEYNSLPKLMKGLGYYTSAFHPDGGGYWNWMPALSSMEFDKCTDVTGFKVDEVVGLGLSDGSYLRQLGEKLSNQKQPFYSFFVTLTSHMPFNLPKEYRDMKLTDNIDKSIIGDYFQSIYYTDKHLGKFIESLNNKGILDNSVLVIYGDHSGVHKYYKDKLGNIKPREDWWYKDNLRVPLIIYSKKLQGEKFSTIGGHIDIMPTVCYLMGVNEKDYINTAMGRNLLKTNKNFVVLSNGVYIGDYKNKEEKQRAIDGLNISDKLLRSNYFKDH